MVVQDFVERQRTVDESEKPMKRVLILSYHFPPDAEVGSRRPLALARYLSEAGWTPTVLTVKWPDEVELDPATLDEVPAGVRVVRTFAIEIPRLARRFKKFWVKGEDGASSPGVKEQNYSGGAGFFRNLLYDWVYLPDKRIGWIPFALRAALKLHGVEHYDVILTTSPPHSVHLTGLLFKALRPSVPWVVDFRDLWTQNVLHSRTDVPARFALELALEDRVVVHAERVVATTEQSRKFLMDRFSLPEEKVVAIPNGYEPWLAESARRHGPNGRFQVAVTGRVYPGTAEPLLRGVDLALRLEPSLSSKLEVVFMGHLDDPALDRMPANLRRFVTVRPFAGKRTAAAIQAESSLLVCPIPERPYASGWLPYRLIEYVSRGRPVLVIGPPGEAWTLARRSKTGAAVEPDNVAGIAETVLAAFRRYQGGKTEVTPDPRVLADWDVRNRVKQYASLLDDVISGKKGARR